MSCIEERTAIAMKKMVSKVLIGIMVVSLALQCAGCGKTPGENNSSEVQGGTTQSQVSNLDSSDASNGSDSQGGSSSADVSGSSSAQSASSKPKPLDPTKVDMKGRTIRLHIGQVEAESTSQVGVKFSQKIQDYVCTLPGSYIREIFIRFVLIAVKLIYEIFHRDAYP